jgi:hypothetical protein
VGQIDTFSEHQKYLRLILDALSTGGTLGHVRAALNAVARQTSDERLKIYLAPVRQVLASTALQTMDDSVKMAFPLDRAPYSALMAYCRRQGG